MKAKLTPTQKRTITRALNILEEAIKYEVWGESMSGPSDFRKYIKLRIAMLEYEVFVVVFLDNQNKIMACEELFRGTIDGASIYPREIIKRALELNAACIAVAHNHPSKSPKPSQADIQLTKRIKAACETVDIRLLDHFLVAGSEVVSFAQEGLI